MKIEKATPQDFQAIQAFYRSRLPAYEVSPTDLFFYASDHGIVVGVVRLARENHLFILRGMQISPEYQRKGLGTTLLKQLDTEIGKNEAYCIPYEHLEGFYGQIGFKKITAESAPSFLQKRQQHYQLESKSIIMHRQAQPAKSVPPLQLKKIHHVAIICSDYARSKKFYAEVLGLKIGRETYREHRDSYKLDLELVDGSQIELFSFPNPPPRTSRPEAQGLRHLAFNVADLEAAVKSLEAQGVEVEPIRVDELTRKRFTFFSDPDGLPLELYGQ